MLELQVGDTRRETDRYAVIAEWDRLTGKQLVKTGHATDSGSELGQNERFVVVSE